MSKERILRDHHEVIIYSETEWDLLKQKRNLALKYLDMFNKEGFTPYIYGSVARGNVNSNSDIDIVFINPIPSFQIEFILNKNGYDKFFREIIMATPKDSIKLYIYISEIETITLPLTKLDKNVLEFYNFGGRIDLNQLKSEIRVPGVDKRLVYIKPQESGHEEMSIIGNESIIAKELNIDIKTINEREKVLLKREKYGRTGVFLKRSLDFNETTEEVLRKLAKSKSIVRKKLITI